DPNPLPVSPLDGAQPRDARQIDHSGGLEQAVLHLRHEVGASGQKLRLGPTFGQSFDTVLYALRKNELESSHERSPPRLVVQAGSEPHFTALRTILCSRKHSQRTPGGPLPKR